MRQTVPLGRVAGVPVGLHWSVLAIVLLLAHGLAVAMLPAAAPDRTAAAYWTVALATATAFLGSVLVHEFAHVLVARHYGVRVRRVTLWLLGGMAEFETEPPHARAGLWTALAGPAVSLLCAAVFGAGAAEVGDLGTSPLTAASLTWLALGNGVLAAFNLLPGAPLDGGRAIAAVIWWLRGDRATGQRAAARLGVGLGTLVLLAGLVEVLLLAEPGGVWLMLIGAFLAAAAHAERITGPLPLADVRGDRQA
jgi:Zn-dependent protease